MEILKKLFFIMRKREKVFVIIKTFSSSSSVSLFKWIFLGEVIIINETEAFET